MTSPSTPLWRLRAQHIVPRLSKLISGAARYTKLHERALQVTWPGTDGKALVLLANLGERAITVAEFPAGKRLYAHTHIEVDNDGLRLPPWSIGWWLVTMEGG